MSFTLVPTLFDFSLSDVTDLSKSILKSDAEKLFTFFKNCPVFKWNDVNNNCEARAEAICILLSEWNVPNYKAWVFSGAFLKKHIGGLKQHWNYHVAAMVQVQQNDVVQFYIIDPATNNSLQTLESWAENITEYPHSYHLIKLSNYYIFPNSPIKKNNWHQRNKQNQKWMIQGLAGINGLSQFGKAQLSFNKHKIHITKTKFMELKKGNPL